MGASIVTFPVPRRDVPHTPAAVITRARKAGLLTDTFEVRATRARGKHAVQEGATPEPIRLPTKSPELAMIYALLAVMDQRERRARRQGIMLDVLQTVKRLTADWGDDLVSMHLRFQAENGVCGLWNHLDRERRR